jgi:hypothetical protein
MVSSKRFTYITADGRRHWAPIINVPWPESYEQPRAGNLCECRTPHNPSKTRKREAKNAGGAKRQGHQILRAPAGISDT